MDDEPKSLERSWKLKSFRAFQPLIIYLILFLPILGWDIHRRYAARTFLRLEAKLEGKSLEAPLQVEVGGQPFALNQPMPLGQQRIKLWCQDTEVWETNKFIWYGDNSLGTVQLKRCRGDLKVAVSPSPLEVTVAGRLTNATSDASAPTFRGLPVGDYRVSLKFQHFTRERRVTVVGNTVNSLDESFPAGHLRIETEPTGGRYELRNVRGDNVAMQGEVPATITDLPAGEYQLLLARGDYTKTRTLALIRGQTNEARVVFEYGQVNVRTEPTNATVLVNGEVTGKTPLSLTNLVPGSYRIEARLEAFQPARWLLEIKGDDTNTVSTNLLSLRYVEAIKRARAHLEGYFKDPRAGLKDVEEALVAKPGDAAALRLKREAEFLAHQQEAREALNSGKLTDALKAVEVALTLKPGSEEAVRLKVEIERSKRNAEERAAEMARQEDERQKLEAKRKADEEHRRLAVEKQEANRREAQEAAKAFGNALRGTPVGLRANWKSTRGKGEVAAALKRAVEQSPDKWELRIQASGESYVQYRLTGTGFPGAARQAVAQCVQGEAGTEIHAAFWKEPIRGPLGLTITVEGTTMPNVSAVANLFREKLEKELGQRLQ